MTDSERLVSAADLEDMGIMRKSTAYRMARRGKIPSYTVGERDGGVRFFLSEVLTALRRPVMNGGGNAA
jgi:hypothetical protein